MKLGIGLPNTLVPDVNRGMFLDWARAADHAGFHSFGTIDRPSHDYWEPLISLAAAAAVTERVRLATTILQMPNRNEVLVAKQAAVIDRLSGGRMDLGLGLGWDENDYKVLGARWPKRGKKFERQIRKIRRIWRAAIYLVSLLLVLLAIDMLWVQTRRSFTPGFDTTRIVAPPGPMRSRTPITSGRATRGGG